MDDLVTFLRARLDEDEAVARDAADYDSWRTDDEGGKVIPSSGIKAGAKTFFIASTWFTEYGEHIARHDPARVLREVEAKRRVVARYEEATTGAAQEDRLSAASWRPVVSILAPVLRDLAEPYADHPDYRSEWAVST